MFERIRFESEALRRGGQGAAATAFPAATAAAVEMLREGGNAIDAAVAAAWAISVCEPAGSGLGGKTAMLIHLPSGQSVVVEGRSRGPAEASIRRISRSQQTRGYLSCSVPTTVSALGHAHARYGALPWQRTIEPAIRLAEEGYRVTRLQRRQQKWCLAALRADPAASQMFLDRGLAHKTGAVHRQPILGRTLRRLAEAGPEDFYEGRIAREICADMERHNGLIRMADLAESAHPFELEPLAGIYRSRRVLSVPPPGGGLLVLLGLRLLERFDPEEWRSDESRWHEALALATQAIYRERESWPFVPEEALATFARGMLSGEAALHPFSQAARSGECEAALAKDMAAAEGEGPGETTHLCTADAQGAIVSLTQSLQSLYGAKVAGATLGFLYNNCLCACPRRPHPSRLGPRCLPRSNMAPTIVYEPPDGPPLAGEAAAAGWRPALALGAAGSRRIVSAILHAITGIVDRGFSLREAVGHARLHVTLKGEPQIERAAASPELLARLARRFGEPRIRGGRSFYMGAVQALRIDSDRRFEGMADPRRDGSAAVL